jgi:hypothetical protein
LAHSLQRVGDSRAGIVHHPSFDRHFFGPRCSRRGGASFVFSFLALSRSACVWARRRRFGTPFPEYAYRAGRTPAERANSCCSPGPGLTD